MTLTCPCNWCVNGLTGEDWWGKALWGEHPGGLRPILPQALAYPRPPVDWVSHVLERRSSAIIIICHWTRVLFCRNVTGRVSKQFQCYLIKDKLNKLLTIVPTYLGSRYLFVTHTFNDWQYMTDWQYIVW